MSIDYRALCAELADALERAACGLNNHTAQPGHRSSWAHEAFQSVAQARATLAQPGAQGLTDERLTLTYARAVAAAVDGMPKPWPADLCERAQLAGLCAVLASHANPCPHLRQGDSGSNWCALAEQGAPHPPAITGRPPRPDECDDLGRVWVWSDETATDPPSWDLEHHTAVVEALQIEAEGDALGRPLRHPLRWRPAASLPMEGE